MFSSKMFNSNINFTRAIRWDLKDLKFFLTNHFKTIQEENAAQYKSYRFSEMSVQE